MSYDATAQGSEPPLDWPYYGIGFGAAIKRFFTKYATFSGRASRGEYWWVVLFNFVVYVVLSALGGLTGSFASASSADGSTNPLAAVVIGIFGLYYLAIIVPSLAIAWRRLHDTGHSGWYYLLGLIPLVGPIILIVFYASQTTPSAEQYGPPASQGGYGGYGQLPPQQYGQPQQPYDQQPQQPYDNGQQYGQQPYDPPRS